MTPREAERLTPVEYGVFIAYANRDIRARNKAARKRS